MYFLIIIFWITRAHAHTQKIIIYMCIYGSLSSQRRQLYANKLLARSQEKNRASFPHHHHHRIAPRRPACNIIIIISRACDYHRHSAQNAAIFLFHWFSGGNAVVGEREILFAAINLFLCARAAALKFLLQLICVVWRLFFIFTSDTHIYVKLQVFVFALGQIRIPILHLHNPF